MGDIWDNYDPDEMYEKKRKYEALLNDPNRVKLIDTLLIRILQVYPTAGMNALKSVANSLWNEYAEEGSPAPTDDDIRDRFLQRRSPFTLKMFSPTLEGYPTVERSVALDLQPLDDQLQQLEIVYSDNRALCYQFSILRMTLPFLK